MSSSDGARRAPVALLPNRSAHGDLSLAKLADERRVRDERGREKRGREKRVRDERIGSPLRPLFGEQSADSQILRRLRRVALVRLRIVRQAAHG